MHSPIILSENLEATQNNSITTSSQISSNIANTSTIDDTIKLATRKKTKVMDSSIYYLKKQEMSPRTKRMHRIIKSLKQKLSRKEEKIHSLKCLLKNLRYDGKL